MLKQIWHCHSCRLCHTWFHPYLQQHLLNLLPLSYCLPWKTYGIFNKIATNISIVNFGFMNFWGLKYTKIRTPWNLDIDTGGSSTVWGEWNWRPEMRNKAELLRLGRIRIFIGNLINSNGTFDWPLQQITSQSGNLEMMQVTRCEKAKRALKRCIGSVNSIHVLECIQKMFQWQGV